MSGPVVVLVEGESDRVALEALAIRRGLDLAAAAIVVQPMGGIGNLSRFLERARSDHGAVCGLYDAAEEREVRRALERAGLGRDLAREGIEALGFFACVEDLEDELIHALGAEGVEGVIESQGELGTFRTFQRQPAWRGRPAADQLRRFIGTHSGRKAEMAAAMVAALELDRVPTPLDRILAAALRESESHPC
jgi:hypothetical protein